MTFGRPTRLSQKQASQTLFFDDLENGTSISSPQEDFPELKFFEAYFHLHLILGDILSIFYTHTVISEDNSERGQMTEDSRSDKLDNMLYFDQRLTEWYHGLDPLLQLRSQHGDAEAATVFSRQGNILFIQ